MVLITLDDLKSPERSRSTGFIRDLLHSGAIGFSPWPVTKDRDVGQSRACIGSEGV